MAGEQPIRPKKSLALGHDNCTFSPLVRPNTPPRVMKHNNIVYYTSHCDNKAEVLSVDAHPVHHFIDELSSIFVLPLLSIRSSRNQSMEDIDEGIEEDLEVIGMTPGTGLRQERKRTRAAHHQVRMSPSPPPPSAESSEVTTSLHLLNQQLSSVMVFVRQMKQDLQNLKDKLP
ncbi:hypothetical protein M9H77_22536 [Catharanthus roseus]|uniref:Uncharacterized protein n=1 Tax=Catharanthus roseus TaxID=4058 RepID=A0ACC0ATD5_CATRO|nr:hypothetical protein M9H77_22536 [Catharanthus roseus]